MRITTTSALLLLSVALGDCTTAAQAPPTATKPATASMARATFYQIGGEASQQQQQQQLVQFRYLGQSLQIDLSKSADAALRRPAANWDQVEVDTSSSGTIAASGQRWARVYVSGDYLERNKLPLPSVTWRMPDYLFQEALYHDANTYARYFGFHASILSRAKGKPAQIRIRSGGQLNLDGTWKVPPEEIDLIIRDFDAEIRAGNFDRMKDDGLTAIGVGDGDPRDGALFIEESEVRRLGLLTIKIPKVD